MRNDITFLKQALETALATQYKYSPKKSNVAATLLFYILPPNTGFLNTYGGQIGKVMSFRISHFEGPARTIHNQYAAQLPGEPLITINWLKTKDA